MSRPTTNGEPGASSDGVLGALREAFEPIARAHGCDLEEVEIKQAGSRSKVSVAIDRDGGVDLDTVADFSREVSTVLDGEVFTALLKGAYTLDVGSRGIDKPLLEPRHWRRALGRLVKIDLLDGSTIKGRLSVFDEAVVTVTAEPDPRFKTSKAPKSTEVALGEVRRAVMEVDFRSLPPGDGSEVVVDDDDDDDDEFGGEA